MKPNDREHHDPMAAASAAEEVQRSHQGASLTRHFLAYIAGAQNQKEADRYARWIVRFKDEDGVEFGSLISILLDTEAAARGWER